FSGHPGFAVAEWRASLRPCGKGLLLAVGQGAQQC
ncbi:hypothetical protein AK812_SmicGene48083, partial [Symbiodinium microadriaticum]